MKIKGHIIAKIILITTMSLLFSILSVMMKNVPEVNVVKQHTESLNLPTANIFDKIDKFFALLSDDLYYKIKPMSDFKIYILCTMFSTILVIFLDLIAGVGRSRFEERMEKRKSQVLL